MDWTNEKDCLKAVKQNGLNLQHVKTQTPKICTAAVKQNSMARKFIWKQLPKNSVRIWAY